MANLDGDFSLLELGVTGMTRHHESRVLLAAAPEAVFDHLDDFHKLSAHMEQRSAMMAGSSMRIETDERGGRAVGSRVRMEGRMMGIPLGLTEVVTQRDPPRRKTWETVDTRLLVIGRYLLGFELIPEGTKTRLRVFIHYSLPEGPARWLGRLFAGMYARWCTGRMAADAAKRFNAV